MARRRRTPNLEPSVKTLAFTLDPHYSDGVGQPVHEYIDLSQCASIVNRRFYRQGLEWAVAGFQIIGNGNGNVVISKVPQTWVASNAYEKTFRFWRQQINDAKKTLGDHVEGKFQDFKVYMDADHHSAGVGANLIPFCMDGSATPFTAGEWDMSQIAISASDSSGVNEYELIWVGPNNPGAGASGMDAKSIIQGYADSRSLPYEEDPAVPSDMSLNWLAAMFNEGTLVDNAVINNLESQGDKAPYPYEGDGGHTDTMYPGGESQAPSPELHGFNVLTSTTIGGMTSIAGGTFQGGLIKVSNQSENLPTAVSPGNGFTSLTLIVQLVPGDHRGYMARPQMEV